jgi:riboflavin biosynthesis pyrimidine reductase
MCVSKWYMPSGVQPPAPEPPLILTRLLPSGPPVTVERIVAELGLGEPGEAKHPRRPTVLLNMISSADGRASIDGRSGALGGRADKELFRGLRTVADAVMAGAGTVRAERYRRLVRDEHKRRIRRERGLAEEPLAAVVSARLELPADIPLFREAGARVVVVTPAREATADTQAEIDYVRAERDGMLDLAGALQQLRERLGVRTLLCEGGPHLGAQLLAAGLADELFLSLAPMLAGDDPNGESLRILSGASLDPPTELRLLAAFEHESHLFLRYRVEHG